MAINKFKYRIKVDYENMTSIASAAGNITYTAPADGLIYGFYTNENSPSTGITINGMQIAPKYSDGGQIGVHSPLSVNKGDIVSGRCSAAAKFVPIYIYIYIYQTIKRLVRLFNIYALPCVCNSVGAINVVMKDYIVEQNITSDSWYRKYKSGWCEQGGVVSVNNALGGTVFNLIIPFKDTNYYLFAMPKKSGRINSGEAQNTAYPESANTFRITSGNATSPVEMFWEAKGLWK